MYDIIIEGELVGSGLSPGELNQWIIELNDELNKKESEIFRNGFGHTEGNFEDFLYSSKLKFPIKSKLGSQVLKIIENTL